MKLPLNIAILCKKNSQIKEQILQVYEPYSTISLETEDMDKFLEHINHHEIQVLAICETAIDRKEVSIYDKLIEIGTEFSKAIIYFYATQSGEEQDIELENVLVYYSYNFSLKKLNYETFLQHIQNYFGITKKDIGLYRIGKESEKIYPQIRSRMETGHKENKEEEPIQEESSIEDVKVRPVKLPKTYKEEGKQYYDDLTIDEKEKLQSYALESVKNITRELQFKTLKSSHAKTRNIGIMNASPKAGSSFLVNNLALALSQLFNISSGVLEAPQIKPYLYYALQKNIPTSWQCGYAYSHKYRKVTMDNFIHYKGVYWMPFHPKTFEREAFTVHYLPSLLYFYTAATLPILFVDISSAIESGFTEDIVLPHVDEIWFVIQDDLYSLPFELERVNEILKKASGKEHHFILNQTTEYTEHKRIKRLLLKDPLLEIPYNPLVKKAAAKQTFCFLTKEGQEWLASAFEPLFARFIKPDDSRFSFSSLKHLLSL